MAKLFNKCFWLHFAGISFVGLGFIGIVLPVMPTTVFFILALACFTRSNPKLANWLLTHKKFGPSLVQWHEYRVIPRKGKLCALLGMSLGFVLLLLSDPAVWVIVTVAVCELMVIAYIFSKPSHRPLSAKLK
ncbi:YbaN family protein [Pseudoalteromonas sp. A25]|uniref:YbaN family protein n=1 Tax=Pseudoalteromonas sp. A25 TaxID=116092 RepID=UPI0012610C79|nr:YbaN family protein [Pseudoalteromonas sp. A25]